MAKKKKSSRKKWLISKKQVNQWLVKASQQLIEQDIDGALATVKRVLRYVPAQSPQRAEALEHMSSAYILQRQFEKAYQTLSKALEITPDVAHIWYNRALVGRYTMRFVQALYDLEKAVALTKNPDYQEKWIELLEETREMVESERALRGPDFTLEQLREQQELFIEGNKLNQQERWAEASEVWRQVINMGDSLPQPWGNLGVTLMMQKKYDEAEAAYKRALEIEPNYDLAQRNLALLPRMRESDEEPQLMMRDPMSDVEIGMDFIVVDD